LRRLGKKPVNRISLCIKRIFKLLTGGFELVF
jgi:hypothetical protein